MSKTAKDKLEFSKYTKKQLSEMDLDESMEYKDRFAVDKVNEDLAKRVLELMSFGLCEGIGDPIPGKMCVEAAVCYAMGEPHSDHPSCVLDSMANTKIGLNDLSVWTSDKQRANVLKKVAIAQLGTSRVSREKFERLFAYNLMQMVVIPVSKINTSDDCHGFKEIVKEHAKELLSFKTFRPMVNLLDMENTNYSHVFNTLSGGELGEYSSSLFEVLVNSVPQARQLWVAKKCVAALEKTLIVDLKTRGSKYLYLIDEKKKK